MKGVSDEPLNRTRELRLNLVTYSKDPAAPILCWAHFEVAFDQKQQNSNLEKLKDFEIMSRSPGLMSG